MATDQGKITVFYDQPIPHIFFALLSIGYKRDDTVFIYPLQINRLVAVVDRILKHFWFVGRGK